MEGDDQDLHLEGGAGDDQDLQLEGGADDNSSGADDNSAGSGEDGDISNSNNDSGDDSDSHEDPLLNYRVPAPFENIDFEELVAMRLQDMPEFKPWNDEIGKNRTYDFNSYYLDKFASMHIESEVKYVRKLMVPEADDREDGIALNGNDAVVGNLGEQGGDGVLRGYTKETVDAMTKVSYFLKERRRFRHMNHFARQHDLKIPDFLVEEKNRVREMLNLDSPCVKFLLEQEEVQIKHVGELDVARFVIEVRENDMSRPRFVFLLEPVFRRLDQISFGQFEGLIKSEDGWISRTGGSLTPLSPHHSSIFAVASRSPSPETPSPRNSPEGHIPSP